MTAVYGTDDAAFRRVDTIRRTYGAWPGVRTRHDGTFGLTYDPGTLLDGSDDLGRYSELGVKAGGERRWPQAKGHDGGVDGAVHWHLPRIVDRALPSPAAQARPAP
jgi:hypothetical protein